MDNEMNYSVVIRTLGTAGVKYKKLLTAISQQTLQPKEVIVVLPYNYTVDHVLGHERFVYCDKGMITQRAVGINNAKSEFVLVVDDDVCFSTTFMEEMFSAFRTTNADAILPNGKGMNQISKFKQFVSNLKYIFIGQRFILPARSKYWVKIAPTGGHKINLNINEDKNYICQTGNFQCFFMKTQQAQKTKLEDEKWLEITNYAIYDDQVFFYKSYMLGNKLVYVPKLKYTHLDGGVGHLKTDRSSYLKNKLYSNTRNRTIFWYKFLFRPAKPLRKVWLFFWYIYATFNTFLLYFIYTIIKFKYLDVSMAVLKGALDGLKYSHLNFKE